MIFLWQVETQNFIFATINTNNNNENHRLNWLGFITEIKAHLAIR